MPVVLISNNPINPHAWERHDVVHAGMFLLEHYSGVWPETAKIYHGSVSRDNDVTPTTEDQIDQLERLPDPLWVVVYPATGVEVAIAIGVVALAASVAAVLLIPDPPGDTPREKSTVNGSPNNSLTERSNRVRLGGRQPDVFGRLPVIPDLLTVPYVVFDDHREKEIVYYCITRGAANVLNVKDQDTLVSQIPGASAHVYGPGQAPTGDGPHSGPQLAIGDPIPDPALTVFAIRAVNGQVIEPFNAFKTYATAKKSDVDGDNGGDIFTFNSTFRFEFLTSSTGRIYIPFLKNAAYVNDRIAIGDQLFVVLPPGDLPGSVAPAPDLNSTNASPLEPDEGFAISPIVTGLTDSTDHVIVDVNIPAGLQAQWALVPAYVAGLITPPQQAGTFDATRGEITSVAHLYQGPFFVDFEHAVGSSNEEVICNFVAPAGLYTDDGVSVQKLDVVIEVRVTPADAAGNATGPSEYFSDTLSGSDITSGNQRALTIRCQRAGSGRFLLSARRVTDRVRKEELIPIVETVDYAGVEAYTGRIVDEIKWTHAYSTSRPPNISFGDVTTIHTMTVATEGATSVKSRELNCFVARTIETWDGASFGGPLVENSDAENVAFTVMKDFAIGNRSDDEIDFQGIATCFESIRDYFNPAAGSDTEATVVNYTLDDNNMSFEETLSIIGAMAFGTFFRQGNVIKCNPEIATDDSVGCYNQRNVLPDSQRITHTFGPTTENDSVEVDYADPFNNRSTSVIVPLNTNVSSTRNARVLGLHSKRQALWHAYRGFNKMLYQRQALEMDSTSEAVDLVVKDRVLIADLTQQNSQTGNVVEVAGLIVRPSQLPVLDPLKTYTIFFHYTDGTVEGIPVVESGSFLQLEFAPSVALVTDPALGVPTIYNIVADDEAMPSAWLVSEKEAEPNQTFRLSAVNYSHMYYEADALDFWVQSTVEDLSPSTRPLSSAFIPTVSDPDFGPMLDFDGSQAITVTDSDDFHDPTHGYAIAAWVRKGPNAGTVLLCQTFDNGQFFGFSASDQLIAGHNAAVILTAPGTVPQTELHMVGVTYDRDAQRLALFVDGVMVIEADTIAPSSTPEVHTYGSFYNGAVGRLMRWRRHWSDSAMMEWYLKTKPSTI